MPGSTAEARLCSCSTSGWSSLSDRTRAITRRCSVMRNPLSAHNCSRSIFWCNSFSARAVCSPPTRAPLPRFSAGPVFLGEIGARFSIVGGDERVIRAEAPTRAIFIGRHAVFGHEMPLEHLHLLAAIEADDVAALDRIAYRDCRFGRHYFLHDLAPKARQRTKHVADQYR